MSNGTEVVAEAGNALDAIQEAVTLTTSQISEIADAAKALDQHRTDVQASISTVRKVFERNTVSTREMADQSTTVTESIADVSAVVEENSAASEEVSASTEEISAQLEEMASSAQELASLAVTLGSAIARFKLNEASGSASAQPDRHDQQTPTSNGAVEELVAVEA